ncbi:MAG: GTP-binding protein [Betaproteobacteria bacterium]|nr:GTP-binding protein [Betaproteobacteria bacterium]
MPSAAGSPASTRDPLASRLPVTIITGFLGSGKTSLLRRLLRHPGMERAAVIINEFGDVGLDHELVEAASEQMMLLSNGCLCCAVRTDLQETLRELFVRRRAGEVIDFDRVFVETTGLADPVPVLHTLDSDSMLSAQYRLNGVVTLVDAVNGMGQLDNLLEAAKQAAVADRLVITKTDIADAAQASALGARLTAMNPYALVSTAIDGRLDPQLLAEIVPASAQALARNPDRWLAAAGAEARLRDAVRAPVPTHGASAHDAAIRSFCLWFDAAFTWDTLNTSLQVLTSLRGPDLLRVKGIVNVAGETGPVAIHGAQHVFHPPVRLESWHGDERRSRIVFIVRDIPRASIEAVFAAVGQLGSAA